MSRKHRLLITSTSTAASCSIEESKMVKMKVRAVVVEHNAQYTMATPTALHVRLLDQLKLTDTSQIEGLVNILIKYNGCVNENINRRVWLGGPNVARI